MKIKARTIILVLSMYCIAIECSWLLMFNITDRKLIYLKQLIYIVLFLYCRFRKTAFNSIKKYIKRIDVFLLITVVFVVIFIVYSILVQNIPIREACDNAFLSYTKFLFVYPLLYIIEKYSLRRIMIVFLVVCSVILLYQSIVVVVYNMKGTIINTNIINPEKEWIRNGMVRVRSLPLSWAIVVIGFAVSLYKTKKRLLINMIWILALAFVVVVNQSRNLFVAILLSLAVMYLFKEKKGKKKIVATLIVCAIIVVLIQSGLLSDFIATFARNTEGDTATTRINKLAILYPMFIQHPILGFGLNGGAIEFASKSIYLIDFGIIGDFMQAGIFALFVYGWTIFILAKNTINLNRKKGFGFTVNSGILVFMLVGLVAYTLFLNNRNFALPCIWALAEYTFNKQKMANNV